MPTPSKRPRVSTRMTPSKKAASARARTTTTTIYRSLPLSRNVGSYRTGFPKQMFMRHKFMQSVVLSGVTLATVKFSTNALFDPDNSGATTHQPMYFDQVSGLYNKYVVLASKATFTFTSTLATGTNSAIVGVYIEDDTTVTPTTAIGCAEQASAQFRILMVNQTSDQFDTTNKISVKWDAKKAFGGDVIDNPNLVAATTANPTEQQFFTIFGQDNSLLGETPFNYIVNAYIEYSVQWFELKNVLES